MQAYAVQGPGTQLMSKDPLRVQQSISLAGLELKFDGPTRFIALPNNRLLVLGEKAAVIF